MSTMNRFNTIRSRLVRALGILTGTGVASVAGSGQVFASLYLQDATPAGNPNVIYSPELQMMIAPDTNEPIFTYSRSLSRAKGNGEYQVAPLITCPGDPSCPKPPPDPTHTVTPGGGPNGPGPKGDSD